MTQGFTSGVIQHLALLLFGVSQQVSISHWSLKTSGDINQKHNTHQNTWLLLQTLLVHLLGMSDQNVYTCFHYH